jgi:Tfp pilus assembly protein PilF
MNRLTQLLAFLEKEPQDAFLHYGLALEYVKENQTEAARKEFEWLLAQKADYLPTYYQAAAFFTTLGEIETAQRVYLKGIEIAQSQQDAFALRELKSAYERFEMEFL